MEAAAPSFLEAGAGVPFDVDANLRPLARSVETRLSPFGYAGENLLDGFRGRPPLAPAPRAPPTARSRPPPVPSPRSRAVPTEARPPTPFSPHLP